MELTVIKKSKTGSRKAYKDKDGNIYLDCSKCDKIKLIECFYKNEGCFIGKQNKCKECQNNYSRKHYEGNRERLLASGKKYYEENKEHIKEYNKKWYEENKERHNEITRKYYYDNKEFFREKSRIWHEANKEHKRELARIWNEENKEHRKEYNKKYAKHNKDKIRLKTQRYRARKKELADTLTSEQVLLLGHHCVLTGDTNDIQLDHVIPLATGHGGTSYENIIPLSAELNQSKRDSNIFEWALNNHERFNFTVELFNEVMTEVATRNDMTLEEYEMYVYWCFENKRELATV